MKPKAELRETGLHFQSYFIFHSIDKDSTQINSYRICGSEIQDIS